MKRSRFSTRLFNTMCLCTLTTFLSISTAFSGSEPPPPIPDLTKMNGWRPRSPSQPGYYNLGPTGMMGIFNGPDKSDQVFVDRIEPGSPAEGKILRGDILLGVNGTPFKNGDNLIVVIGNAINEGEKDENKGKITFTVWRDENWPKRTAEIDVTKVSVDDILASVKEEDDNLGEWRTEEQQKNAESREYLKTYEKFPMQASTKEITITLRVMGSFSPTAPFNCSKTEKILEAAWPHIEVAAEGGRRKTGLSSWRSGTIGLALLASGKPEHLKLCTEMLHRNKKLMAGTKISDGWGLSAWFSGYYLTFLGEYYLRTGDKAVLPGLRQWALAVAKNQAYGGSWGHGGHARGDNFGNLHGPATGYGAMNQAAGPCFYGLTLAQKANLNEPIVDEAVRRSVKFYATYVDKGCVPYGFHGPGMHEDSNGKNGPPALAMRMVGETYKAKYYALCSSVAAGWGYRGGHGDGTFGNYWPALASSVAGKEAVAFWMKQMHPWYTMLRRHNGSFVCVEHGSKGGFGGLFNQTAMYSLHFSIPKAKLYMTGRDVTPEYRATKRELMHLKNRSKGYDWRKLSTDEIISNLDTFSAEQRLSAKKGYPSELLKRYKAGETDMVDKLLKMVNHEHQLARSGAFYMLSTLGVDAAQKAQPYAIKALNDPVEVVRMGAVTAIRTANSEPVEVGEKPKKGLLKVELDSVVNPLFAAALQRFEDDTHDTYNTHYLLQQLMINSNNVFARAPFDQGYDTQEVAEVLERFLTQDPRSGVMDGPSRYWDRATTIRMAGPIVFVSENFPMNGVMFGGSAPRGGQSLLIRHKYIEGIEAGTMGTYKVSRVPRVWRSRIGPTKLGWCSPPVFMNNKGMGKSTLPWLRKALLKNPNIVQKYNVGRDKRYIHLTDVIRIIESNEEPGGWRSLRKEAMKAYLTEVDAKGGKDAQVAYCRKTLDPTRKTYFRQLAAMDRLVELLGVDAVKDLSPYIGHEHWRFQDHARAYFMKFKGDTVVKTLVELADSKDENTASAALIVLGDRGDKEGVTVGMKHISSHKSELVRGVAARAVYGGSQGGELNKILDLIKGVTESEELDGFEAALLLRKSDKAQSATVAATIKKTIPKCSIPVRSRLYYVLGQFGGTDNLNYLKSRVDTEEQQELIDIIDALSWSPDIAATQVLLDILNDHQGTLRAAAISKGSVRRLVNGGEELARVPDKVNLDFAEAHLKVFRNLAILTYLGNIKGARCLELLLNYMKLGPSEVTEAATSAIVRSANLMKKEDPLNERKGAAEILAQAMEYINVVYTRKDISEVSMRETTRYAKYKKLADNAGVILKRIYSPDEEVIDVNNEGIDGDDLDL